MWRGGEVPITDLAMVIIAVTAGIAVGAGMFWIIQGWVVSSRIRDAEERAARIVRAAEKEAEQAYKRSLGNIPEQKPSDPWGAVRSESAPKTVAKDPAAKRTKASGTAN